MNRQVPLKPLIIGNGRLARHLCHYFTLASIDYDAWNRTHDSVDELKAKNLQNHLFLLAISDSAIEAFIKEHALPPQRSLHFSGSLFTELALQMHPLMSFPHTLYDLTLYSKVPFISSSEKKWKDFFPKLKNETHQISQEKIGLYHALCVFSGNGTLLLWQKVFAAFEEKLGLNAKVLLPYLEQVTENLKRQQDNTLTGPWVRNDQVTISKNKSSLQQTNFLPVYNELLELYKKEILHENHHAVSN